MERVVAGKPGVRRLATAGVAVALIAGLLALAGSGAVSGQEAPDCDISDLGTLGAETDSLLQAEGRWTTEDCDSRFRAGNDAHTYRFEVRSAGRVRIELSSAGADSYLYLLAADGTRIADNDDGGAGLAARIERDLAPGVYMVEATTIGGRGRGAAGFTLTVGRVAGCDIVPLGVLAPGADLTATGSWSLDTCGSRIVASHPAHNYTFILSTDGRVRIDLTSESGDPVLSLASLDGGVIGANDDGGGGRNSRIEQYLPAGVYFIEATTYLTRDLQPLDADFTLTVHLVDEVARQQDFQLKAEEVHIPEEVIAGDPFSVNYRVGNAGGGDLPGGGNVTFVYVVGQVEGGRRVIDVNGPVAGPGGVWPARTSYHSDDRVASATSVTTPAMRPLEITFKTSGPAWVFVGVVTEDADGNELGFHGIWTNLTVLSGPAFEPVKVDVDGADYWVSADADAEGTVTTSVKAVGRLSEEVDESTRAKAIYAAGVRARLLDGVFGRPALAALAGADEPLVAPVVALPADPSSGSLLETFGVAYAALVGSSGPAESVAAGEAINRIAAEELVLAVAARASGRFASLASSWSALLGRLEGGGALRLDEALSFQSELAYAEAVLAPVATAGRIVAAAREAEPGWAEPGVRAMIAELDSCGGGEADLAGALAAAGQDAEAELVALDTEMRAVLPVWGPVVDSALCGAAAADAANFRFLERLGISGSREVRDLLAFEAPPVEEPAPEPFRLRVIARLTAEGRVEHGVQLTTGLRILPEGRFLAADAPAGAWRESGDVEVGENPIGRIRARRLADGRVELAFRSAGGEAILPDVRYLPADAPEGIWFYGGEIEVTAGSGPSE